MKRAVAALENPHSRPQVRETRGLPMSADSAAVLRHLFAIHPSQIDRDTAEGHRDVEELMEVTAESLLGQRDSADPEVVARYLHTNMVRAVVARSLGTFSEGFTLFFSASAADAIAEEAKLVALGGGRLAELGLRMDAIRRREGLAEDESWPVGEGPIDYQDISDESSALFTKVYDTTFTTVLRRYDLGDIADLYESDRPAYEELWEIGRQSLLRDEVDEGEG
jgi:hypothetical protein